MFFTIAVVAVAYAILLGVGHAVTGPGGVWVISSSGEHLGAIEVPENVGNLTWGGNDWRALYMPSSTSLYSIGTKVRSRREPYMG